MKTEVKELIDMLRTDEQTRREFDMSFYLEADPTIHRKGCGTVGCIAGTYYQHFIAKKAEKIEAYAIWDSTKDRGPIIEEIEKSMGIEPTVAEELFLPDNWIENWKSRDLAEIRMESISSNQRPSMELWKL